MPTTIESTIIADFRTERVTKNTVRFAEVVADGEDAAIGTLYVQKAALVAAGVDVDADDISERFVTLTITVA